MDKRGGTGREAETEEETETETIQSKSHGLLGPETEIQCDISVTGVDHVLVNVCVFFKKKSLTHKKTILYSPLLLKRKSHKVFLMRFR